MRPPIRRLQKLLIAMVLTLTGVLTIASAAAAHTSLVAASPEPDTEVGGHVDRVDLEFGGDISGPGIVVTDPDGKRLGGVVSQPFTNRASILLADPLVTPGRYSVDYAIISTDGDRVDQTFAFDFEPNAPAPVPLPTPGSGPSQLLLITIGIALGCALVGGFTYLQGRGKRD